MSATFELDTSKGPLTIVADNRKDAHEMAWSKGASVYSMYEVPEPDQSEEYLDLQAKSFHERLIT